MNYFDLDKKSQNHSNIENECLVAKAGSEVTHCQNLAVISLSAESAEPQYYKGSV